MHQHFPYVQATTTQESQIILLGPQHRVARIKIARYPHSFRAEQHPPHCTGHWGRILPAVCVVEADTHSAALQSSDGSVDLLYKELMVIGEDQWRSSVDFVETGVGTVRREF